MAVYAGTAWALTSSKLATESSNRSVSALCSVARRLLLSHRLRQRQHQEHFSCAAAARSGERLVIANSAVHSSAKVAQPAAAIQCCLTPRSSGTPTACHQGPPAVQYIVCRRALASCRRRPLSSNVRPRIRSTRLPSSTTMQNAVFDLVKNTDLHSMCRTTEHGLQVQKLHLDRSKAVRVNSAHGRLRFVQS